MAIVLALSASVGSLIPLLVLTPEKLATEQGRLYLAGTAIMLVGIVVASYAGFLRDRLAQGRAEKLSQDVMGQKSFVAGLLVATFAGLFSSSLNFVYAFGSGALAEAQRAGASPVWMSNVIAAPAVSGGFIANALYCGYLLRRNRTGASFFRRETRINWVFGALMGALWFGGQALYGLGVYRMGTFGTVIGWPLLMGTIIVTSNFAGLFTGEWAGSDRRVYVCLGLGIAIILIALYVLSLARQS
jgi:L-rhamnose-H+ transport protein